MARTLARQPVEMSGNLTARIMFAGRASSLSAQIVADTRNALFAKKLKPGDFLGTEKDLAARFGVSRIVARDALRTLEALGIVEIRMGKGGGARIAHGNPRLFAEALAVQLDLTGVSAAEIMDAQRAIETLGAELAAENANAADIARLRQSATSTPSQPCRAISI
jgi:GntR family transcriptional repressor for pyruvate dehydrogenase complex